MITMSSTKTNEEHKKSVANTKINKIFIGQLWDHNLCCRRFLQLISIIGTEGALRLLREPVIYVLAEFVR